MGLDPTAIKLFSYDGGETYGGLGCGARTVKPDAIDQAREAAGLDDAQRTILMGSAVVGFDFKPPLSDDLAQIFARTIGESLGVDQVVMLGVDPLHQQGPTEIGHIMLNS